MNKWNIPAWLEKEVRERDKLCVYCRVPMVESLGLNDPRKALASWEHIDNDAKNISRGNIARCCTSCNSSKGTKTIAGWLESDYCKKRGINKGTVSGAVRRGLR